MQIQDSKGERGTSVNVVVEIPSMPKDCVVCQSMGIRNLNGCQLIFDGCANCGRHPLCPLIEVEAILPSKAKVFEVLK